MVHDIELNLRRLLLRCEQHVEDAERASTTSPSGPPLHTYAETLQQMLKELDAAHEEGLIARHSLLSLRERVQRVSDAAISEKRVREPAYCRTAAKVEFAAMLGAAARSTGSDAYVAGSATASGGPPPLQPLNPIAAHHHFMHDELTDDMAELASGIKQNSLRLEKELREASKTLDATEGVLEGNVSLQRAANDKAKEQYSRASYGGCLKWILLVVVGLLFSWMVLFIRTFSDKVVK